MYQDVTLMTDIYLTSHCSYSSDINSDNSARKATLGEPLPVYQQGEKLLWFAERSVCGKKRAHKVRIYKQMKPVR